jgi:hypothetical protein
MEGWLMNRRGSGRKRKSCVRIPVYARGALRLGERAPLKLQWTCGDNRLIYGGADKDKMAHRRIYRSSPSYHLSLMWDEPVPSASTSRHVTCDMWHWGGVPLNYGVSSDTKTAHLFVKRTDSTEHASSREHCSLSQLNPLDTHILFL